VEKAPSFALLWIRRLTGGLVVQSEASLLIQGPPRVPSPHCSLVRARSTLSNEPHPEKLSNIHELQPLALDFYERPARDATRLMS
jgi:hypothetical protein